MNEPYGLISDLHAHAWDAFSSLDGKGRNTRLMHIIHEVDRCCDMVRNEGGTKVIIAGDVFHVRGSVSPAVYNPLKAAMREQAFHGIQFWGIAGNHDLSDKESTELGSAVAMLTMDKHRVNFYHKPWVNKTEKIAYVPWVSKPADYMATIDKVGDDIRDSGDSTANYDLICHIGIDGTLTGVPSMPM